MKIIDISDRLAQRVSAAESEPQAPEDGAIIELGRCAGCQLVQRLEDFCCSDCRDKFGEKSGLLFRRIRDDQDFAAKFYSALMPNKRRSFIRLFGLPPGCCGPVEKPPQGSRPRLCVVSAEPTQSCQDPDS